MSGRLLKSISTVSLMTLISRILGFLRDMVCAHVFGASLGFDAFLLAFKIPNFLRRLFAEGAFSQAFVPILSEYKTTQDPDTVHALIHKVAGNLSLVLFGVTGLGIVAAPICIALFAPGFIGDSDRFSLGVELLRITFPYLLFISLTALAGGIFNTYQRFALPAITPVLLNISLIISALFISPYFAEPVKALAWGVLVGGVVQLLLQIPFLKRAGFTPRLKVDWKDPGVKRILKLMMPALVGASVMQINLLVDTLFASFLRIGSMSWLYYSERLLELPIGMFGVAIATVTLPHLASYFAKREERQFTMHLDWALKWSLLIGIPAALGLFVLAEPILATLFQRGAFVANDVVMAAKSLRMLALGLGAFMVIKVLISAFYARQNTRFPMKVAIVALISNIVLNCIFIKPLAHAGLTLASSLSAFIQMGLLAYMLKRQGCLQWQGWSTFMLQIGTSNTLMVTSLWYLSPELVVWLDMNSLDRAMHLMGYMSLAFALYVLSLWALGLRARHLITESA